MRLVTPKELEKLTGRHWASIYRDIRKGKIPCVPTTVEKKVLMVPWDDEKGEICQAG